MIRGETELQVDAWDGEVEAYSMNLSGEKYQVGSIHYRDYERKRQLRVPYFRTMKGEEYRLGKVTGAFQIIDHYTALEPLIHNGFVPQFVHPFRGNTLQTTLFSHPELQLPDFINWDSFGADADSLHLGVMVTSSLRPGRGLSYVGGLFRVICTNGLMSKILGCGYLATNHRNYQTSKIEEWSSRLVEDIWPNQLSDPQLYPKVPTSSLSWGIDQLNGLSRDVQLNLPSFAIEPLQNLQRLPNWAFPLLAGQLERLQSSQQELNIFDLLNALTNLVYHGDETRGPHTRSMMRLESYFSSLIDIVEIGSFLSGAGDFQRLSLE